MPVKKKNTGTVSKADLHRCSCMSLQQTSVDTEAGPRLRAPAIAARLVLGTSTNSWKPEDVASSP